MACFKIENLSFKYPNCEENAIENINLEIEAGEFVTLCGNSGCGKTTLLRLLKPSLSPSGASFGKITFGGIPINELSEKQDAAEIGFVMQDPENQTVTDKVWHELAFGLENLGIPTGEIRARVAETASFFGIQKWFRKKTSELSGGEKQLLALASVMVMQPEVLILDEPTGRLDPIAAHEFIKTLEKINRELGTTVILSEHRLEDVIPVSDRVIVLENGRISAQGSAAAVFKKLVENKSELLGAFPVPMLVCGADGEDDIPQDVRGGRFWLSEYAKKHGLHPEHIKTEAGKNIASETAIELKDVWYRYEKDAPDVLRGINVKIRRGEFFALMGGNGSGKTTALRLMAGLSKPLRGKIVVNGKKTISMLPQDPKSLFVKESIYLDLSETASGATKTEKEEKIKEVAALCRIKHLLSKHPYDVSGGEQQRAALAKVLLTSPEILLLDEPTKGTDIGFKNVFAKIISDIKSKGTTVIMVSHDTEFCARHADRCALVFDGEITSCEEPRAFFAGKMFYTTAANRMARGIIPGAVLPEDILAACGKESVIKKDAPEKEEIKKTAVTSHNNGEEMPPKRKKISKKTLLSIALIIIAMPVTVFLGSFLGGNKRYYITSLLVICEAMIPFFAAFESRRPHARELVTVSVLCALAVASRAAFFMLPQFKPMCALIIISGAALGGESGFLIGAISAFVSNFFFGQGPWTPWQMLAFGLIGFLAGVMFKKLKKTRLTLCIYGALAAFFIYGGIINPASLLFSQTKINLATLAAAYVAGAPFDLVHAASTVIFLLIAAKPILSKLERIKTKYGTWR